MRHHMGAGSAEVRVGGGRRRAGGAQKPWGTHFLAREPHLQEAHGPAPILHHWRVRLLYVAEERRQHVAGERQGGQAGVSWGSTLLACSSPPAFFGSPHRKSPFGGLRSMTCSGCVQRVQRGPAHCPQGGLGRAGQPGRLLLQRACRCPLPARAASRWRSTSLGSGACSGGGLCASALAGGGPRAAPPQPAQAAR